MTERNALWFAALTSLTWGLTGVFVRLLPPIPPLTITAGRLVIALVAALPVFLVVRGARHSIKGALRHRASYTLALLLAGYYLLATAAFQMAPVAEVALLLSTPPLFVLAIRRVRGESSSRAEIGGALLALTGIVIILAPRISFAESQTSQHLYGDIIAICAAALTAIYAYTYRLLSESGRSPESVGVSLLTFAIGGMGLALAVILKPTPSGVSALDSSALLVFLGLGILSTAVPSLGFAIASKRLPAIITAMISLFIPLFSGLFAFLILGERLSIMFLVGCVLVLLGVAVIIRNGGAKTID